MKPTASPGAKFHEALAQEKPLQVIGTINAYHALMAKRTGYKAIYLSGGGVAAGSLGLPDLGISTLEDVLTDVRRITDVCDLPSWWILTQASGQHLTLPGRSSPSSNSARPDATSRTRYLPNVADIVPERRWYRKMKWWTGLKPRWMRVPMSNL